MYPRSKQWHTIDFVITRQGDRSLVDDTRVYRSIDCWSDHCFLGSSISVPCSHHHKRTSTHKTVEAVIVPLPKKGNLEICDNWRGISLLSVPGKVFGRIIADGVQKLAETMINETQCGFRKMRGCNDMVFVARQLQEKAREQQCSLNICFFDIKKAYDTVNRDILWPLLLKWFTTKISDTNPQTT